ncbi:MAG: SRPBCC domain-containing protein [Dehalococcoidia bacterium]
MTEDAAIAERTIEIKRMIDGPRHLVFRAFSDARHLDRWWGPDGFTTATRSFEFRAGGTWDFVMHGPDGTDYQEWIEWLEISAPERITMRHGERPGDPDAMEGVITFIDRGDRTEVVLTTVFPSKALRDRAVQEFHAVEGGEQTLGHLAAFVEGGNVSAAGEGTR